MIRRLPREPENLLPVGVLLCSLILMLLCVGFDKGKRPPQRTLTLGQPFTVTLEEDHSTQYRWKPVYDKNFLRLREVHFAGNASSKKGSRKARKQEIGQKAFTFVPIRTGSTRVTFNYRHPDESSPADRREVILKIVQARQAPTRRVPGRPPGRSRPPIFFGE